MIGIYIGNTIGRRGGSAAPSDAIITEDGAYFITEDNNYIIQE